MKFIATFITFISVWILLNGLVLSEVIAGVIVSAILAAMLSKYTNFEVNAKFPLLVVKFVFIYIPVFVIKLVLSNIDIARRVLTPKIPLKPGIVKLETDLQGEMGKLVLANSITLTPGTLTVDVGDGLYVHTVEVVGQTKEEHKENVSSAFENILKGIFK
jgi:multicomponent Na+:H+ antiporter subunit E